MPTRADRHLRAIQLAQDCHELGARARTIHHVTSLPPRDLQRFFFTDPKATPRGRAPEGSMLGEVGLAFLEERAHALDAVLRLERHFLSAALGAQLLLQ